MLLRIQHQTDFEYSETVSDTVFEVRMAPSSDEDQTVLGYQLRVTPPAPLMSYRDGFGNRVDLFNILSPYRGLSLEAVSHVRTHRRPAPERLDEARWEDARRDCVDALDYLARSPLVDASAELEQLVDSVGMARGRLADMLVRMVELCQARVAYEKKVTTERTRLSEALRLGRGVCQDFAHLYIGLCRGLGLPARYVTGYVNHPGEIATHAWCQVWCGAEVGWIDVDPTAGIFVGDDHVVLAVGRDYADVPPNRGVWKGVADERMQVRVMVESVDRVPTAADEWPGTHARRQPMAVGSTRTRVATRYSDETFPAFPDQPLPKTQLYRQQGQQQQQ